MATRTQLAPTEVTPTSRDDGIAWLKSTAFNDRLIDWLWEQASIAHQSPLLPIKDRKAAIAKLRRYLRFLQKLLIPDLRKLKEVTEFGTRFSVFEDCQRIRSKLQDIRKKARRIENRKVYVRSLLTDEGVVLPDRKITSVCEEMTHDMRMAVSEIVAAKYNKSSSVIRKIIAPMLEDEHGIIHLKKSKGRKKIAE